MPAARCGRCRSSTAVRSSSASPCSRGGDGTGGRASEHHPDTARTRQPGSDLDLSPGDRQRRDHRDRPLQASAGYPGLGSTSQVGRFSSKATLSDLIYRRNVPERSGLAANYQRPARTDADEGDASNTSQEKHLSLSRSGSGRPPVAGLESRRPDDAILRVRGVDDLSREPSLLVRSRSPAAPTARRLRAASSTSASSTASWGRRPSG